MFATVSKTLLGKTYNPPALDTPTRWNSTHVMLRECTKFKQVLVAILSANSISVDVDWRSVEDVQLFLEVPAKVSTQLGTSHYCSLSKAMAANTSLIDHCNRNVDHVNPVIAEASQSMLNSLIHHSKDLTCKVANIAKFLDLRMSRDTTTEEYKCDHSLVETMLEMLPTRDDEVIEVIDSPGIDYDSDIDLFGSTQSTPKTKVQSELQLFARHPQFSRDMDVLLWWKTHRMEYPRLYQLAMNYLAVLATSVPNSVTTCSKQKYAWIHGCDFSEGWDVRPKRFHAALDELKSMTNLQELAKEDSVIQQYLEQES
ncbi:hypothetical protein Ae201684P_014273 [Aphanomyces euteiches]|nr:hypothetical protein Ae201684P_014273 [Aphanomyces euteiches]